MLVAIHQPNFIPHPAYFAKMARADAFILLDTAQYSKGSWTNRNKLQLSGKVSWITVPVEKSGKGFQPISKVCIHRRNQWEREFLMQLDCEFARTPGKEWVLAALQPALKRKHQFLAGLNIELITGIRDLLGIETTLHIASEMTRPATSRTDATGSLIGLTIAAGGSAYLSGPSGRKYMEEEAFGEAGLQVEYADYELEPYPRSGEDYVPGLSILDMLFHLGPEKAREHLLGGL